MAITAGQNALASDFISTSAGAADSGKVPKLDANGKLDASFVRPPVKQTYNADATWRKPTGLYYIIVKMWGGGGSGASTAFVSGADSSNSGGGGGAEYAEKRIEAADLGATEAVVVGDGGAVANNAAGNDGEDSTFGAHLTAKGGKGGGRNTGSGPVAQPGGDGGGFAEFGHPHAGQGAVKVGIGDKNGIQGGGAGSDITSGGTANGAGTSVYGGAGGGGAAEAGSTSAGGTSKYGGNGGAAAANVGTAPATAGTVPGGGGGAWNGTNTGGSNQNSGAGGKGRVIVEEFFA